MGCGIIVQKQHNADWFITSFGLISCFHFVQLSAYYAALIIPQCMEQTDINNSLAVPTNASENDYLLRKSGFVFTGAVSFFECHTIHDLFRVAVVYPHLIIGKNVVYKCIHLCFIQNHKSDKFQLTQFFDKHSKYDVLNMLKLFGTSNLF